MRARIERGDSQDNFTLTDLDTSERRALEGLLGRAPKVASSMQLRQTELDSALSRAGLAPDLRTALEWLDGPIVNRRLEQAAYEQAWNALRENVGEPRLRALLAEPLELGLLKRLALGEIARAEQLLSQAHQVLAKLPARGTPLAHLAAETLGDSHALDVGQPVATLVLRAFKLGELQDDELALSADSTNTREVPDDRSELFKQEQWAGLEVRNRADAQRQPALSSPREQWARLGVSVNELASPVLFLNLRCQPESEYAGLIDKAATRGLPLHLTLRALLRNPPEWTVVAGQCVFVCENPAIVALAADQLGHECAPLVCTDGMPGAAQRTLLRQLVAAGAQLFYHGDFDWPGLHIGNYLMRELGARPWRFGTADYLAADARSGKRLEPAKQVQALWDAGLASAMLNCGFAVHEERVAQVLLADINRNV